MRGWGGGGQAIISERGSRDVCNSLRSRSQESPPPRDISRRTDDLINKHNPPKTVSGNQGRPDARDSNSSKRDMLRKTVANVTGNLLLLGACIFSFAYSFLFILHRTGESAYIYIYIYPRRDFDASRSINYLSIVRQLSLCF